MGGVVHFWWRWANAAVQSRVVTMCFSHAQDLGMLAAFLLRQRRPDICSERPQWWATFSEIDAGKATFLTGPICCCAGSMSSPPSPASDRRFFVFLDSSLTPPVDADLTRQGVSEELEGRCTGAVFITRTILLSGRLSYPGSCTGFTEKLQRLPVGACAVHSVLSVECGHLFGGYVADGLVAPRSWQRSMHNPCFTLPVLFAMLSNHYSFSWSHPQNWLVLILMMLTGAAIGQFFVLRHGTKLNRNRHPAAHAAAGVVVIVGVVVWMQSDAPDLIADKALKERTIELNDYQTVQKVFQQRCYARHGANVQMKNVRLDSPGLVKQHAPSIYQQVVVSKIMPMNNATGITDAERGGGGQSLV